MTITELRPYPVNVTCTECGGMWFNLPVCITSDDHLTAHASWVNCRDCGAKHLIGAIR